MKKINILLSIILAVLFTANTFSQDPGPAKRINAKVEVRGPFAAYKESSAIFSASVVKVEMRVYAENIAEAIAGFEIYSTSTQPIIKKEINVRAGAGQIARDEYIDVIYIPYSTPLPLKARVYAEAKGYSNASYAYATSTLTW